MHNIFAMCTQQAFGQNHEIVRTGPGVQATSTTVRSAVNILMAALGVQTIEPTSELYILP